MLIRNPFSVVASGKWLDYRCIGGAMQFSRSEYVRFEWLCRQLLTLCLQVPLKNLYLHTDSTDWFYFSLLACMRLRVFDFGFIFCRHHYITAILLEYVDYFRPTTAAIIVGCCYFNDGNIREHIIQILLY